MEAVGYDLYCKLLNEAVLALRGEKEAEDFETVVDCDIDAYIPPSYIRNEYQNSTFTSGFPVSRTRKSTWICRMS